MTITPRELRKEEIVPFAYLPGVNESDLRDNGLKVSVIEDDESGPLLFSAESVSQIEGVAVWEHYVFDRHPGFTLSLSRDASRPEAVSWLHRIFDPAKLAEVEWLEVPEVVEQDRYAAALADFDSPMLRQHRAVSRLLVNEVSQHVGLSKEEADEAVAAIVSTIVGEIRAGNRVSIFGFGTFEPRTRAARTARNPVTRALVDVPATKSVAFKPASAFKQNLNSKTSGRSADTGRKAPGSPKSAATKKRAPAAKTSTSSKAVAKKKRAARS
jgi:DNA-binding protein HU-beta